MFSQNNEEEIIGAELTRMGIATGHFLDIGAWNGITYSNTYRLVELGWRGVCVEPSPYVFPKLVENLGNNPLIHLVNAAVAIKPKLIPWFDSGGDAISTTSEAHRDKWIASCKVPYKQFWIYVMPLAALFDTFGFDFDFINIDVESTNLELFRALPWPALKTTKLICVEHDLQQLEMSQLAAKYGFSPLSMNGENLILTRPL